MEKKDFEVNPLFSQRSSEQIEIRPIESLRWTKNSDGSVRYTSDVTLLMNAERIIEDLGEDNYRNIIRGITPAPSTYAENNFTDEQLLMAIKSRYIQHPSEVKAWMDMLVSDGNDIINESEKARKEAEEAAIAAKAAEIAAQQEQQQQQFKTE